MHSLYSFEYNQCIILVSLRYGFHIGVGSDVVCSTKIGSCKSLRKWNRQQDDSTLFSVATKLISV